MKPIRLFFYLFAAFLLASCGGDKAGDGRTTIRLFHWMERDRDLWQEKIIAPFEQAHPGIHVVLETAPYGLYVSRCMTSIASGEKVADLMFAEDWFGQELIQRGYARNLMPLAEKNLNLNDFFEDAFREWRGVAQRPGELFGFPAAVGMTVLFYNKDLFDRARLAYPDTNWTYDDLTRAAQALTIPAPGGGSPEQWGLHFDVHYTGLETVIYSMGGRVLSDDLAHADLSGPATTQAFAYVRDLFLKYRVARAVTSAMAPWEPFISRKAAMNLIGSHGIMSLTGTGIRWDLTMPPKGKDGRRWSRRFSMAYLIPRNSEHPEEAWSLLAWILTRSPVETIDRQYLGMMPTYRPTVSSPAWLDAEPRYNRRVIVELAEHHSLPLYTPGWQEWRDNGLT
ncbi:MAG TPA: sugar ABC transporter substrate-binding protein, partial [Bacteroidota bacterium]